MPVRSETVARSWEDSVVRAIGDIRRRISALERRSGPKRQVFVWVTNPPLQASFTWMDPSGIVFGSYTGTLQGNPVNRNSVTFRKNGAIVVMPFDVAPGDYVLVTVQVFNQVARPDIPPPDTIGIDLNDFTSYSFTLLEA